MTTNLADLWPDSLAGASIGALQSSLDFWNSLPFKVLFVGHALYCTAAGTEFKDRWLLHLLVSSLLNAQLTVEHILMLTRLLVAAVDVPVGKRRRCHYSSTHHGEHTT